MATTRELDIIENGPSKYEFSSNLNGLRFYLEFKYNTRNDTWYMTIRDANRQTLLQGISCLTSVEEMTGRFALDEIPTDGEIQVSDSNDTGRDPTKETFGGDISAFYLSLRNG